MAWLVIFLLCEMREGCEKGVRERERERGKDESFTLVSLVYLSYNESLLLWCPWYRLELVGRPR